MQPYFRLTPTGFEKSTDLVSWEPCPGPAPGTHVSWASPVRTRKPKLEPSESAIQRVLLARLNALPGVVVWRQNTGRAKPRHGSRPITFGRPGQADITGIVQRGIGGIGQRLEIEVKSAKGKQSELQAAFQRDVESRGGIYILARDIDSTLAIVARLSVTAP